MPVFGSSNPNPLATSPTATSQVPGIVSSSVPGAQNLANLASTNTANLLGGLPSTSAARKANAVFGAGSGLAPGSDFLKTRMFDTYGTQVDQRNQQGLQNFLSLIGGLTSPALAENAQNNQQSNFSQSLAQQKQQFADNLAQRQEEFNRSNDLALQEFGFNRSRYYQSQHKRPQPIGNVSEAVPGAGEANMRIDQTNAGNPSTFWGY